jgi:hypothetical protein
MDIAYIAWIIAMIAFAAIIEILDDAQWDRKKYKLRIAKHHDRTFR